MKNQINLLNQLQELIFPEGVQIGRGADQLQVVQLFHGGFAAQDIHSLPRDEMQDPSFDLGRTAGRIRGRTSGLRPPASPGEYHSRGNG